MGYEKEQKRLLELWNELMSASESDLSPDASNYESLRDSYSDSDPVTPQKRTKIFTDQPIQKPQFSIFSSSNNIDEIIKQVIAHNINYEDESDEDDINQETNTNFAWMQVSGIYLNDFSFTENNSKIRRHIYDDYQKSPYDFYKMLITDEIFQLFVNETNLYAHQEKTKSSTPISRIKQWRDTNQVEMKNSLNPIISKEYQMKPSNSSLRRDVEWYGKLAIELVIGAAIVNAYWLHQHVTNGKMTTTEFREEVIEGIVHNIKPTDDAIIQQPTNPVQPICLEASTTQCNYNENVQSSALKLSTAVVSVTDNFNQKQQLCCLLDGGSSNVNFHTPGETHLLLGADVFWQILCAGQLATANRINEIHLVSEPQDRYHVSSNLLSRGMSPKRLLSLDLWFKKPLFLKSDIFHTIHNDSTNRTPAQKLPKAKTSLLAAGIRNETKSDLQVASQQGSPKNSMRKAAKEQQLHPKSTEAYIEESSKKEIVLTKFKKKSKRFDVGRIKDENVRSEYQPEVRNRFEALALETVAEDIEDTWNQVKDIYVRADLICSLTTISSSNKKEESSEPETEKIIADVNTEKFWGNNEAVREIVNSKCAKYPGNSKLQVLTLRKR
ncbi:hypothetical protein ILUMI_08034 [Ignelater luminosus]|uniref:Uncharacterized protein n=1 Tax=Ignelater luminosus TaxID=2038154 RepID=A0A8K0D6D2_IGNLU|nr:hypothetical protein ILUMI_08034 [Ignelater luminosus]